VYALAPRHQYSGYAFEFTASRNVQPYVLKVIPDLTPIPVQLKSRSASGWRTSVVSVPLLPYMTRLDVFILASTLLVFFSLIEVVATIILDNTQKKKRAVRIDRYCRFIFPVIFGIASIATFAHPRG
jgi:hypothetical protein